MKKIIFLAFTILFTASYMQAQFPQIYSRTPTSVDGAVSMAIDANGNVYVTGYSIDFPSSTNAIVTIKYNSSGVVQSGWPQVYSSANEISPKEIVVDGSANVYITGTKSNGTNRDFITIKYNTNGVLIWTQTYDWGFGGSLGEDIATGIALDNQDNIYVTGYSYIRHRYADNYDMVTIAYNPDGTRRWVNIFDLWDPEFGTGHGDDYAYDIAVYNPGTYAGAVFLCGTGWGGSSTLFDNVTVRINLSDGAHGWWSLYSQYEVPANDAALAINVSQATGKVYTTGYKLKNGMNFDCFTMQNSWDLKQGIPCHYCEDWCASFVDDRYEPNCNPNPPTDYGDDQGTSIMIVDNLIPAKIKIYVAGYTSTQDNWQQANGFDYLGLRYAGTADVPPCGPYKMPVSIRTYNGPGNSNDFAKSIDLDNFGNVYVTGAAGGWVSHIETIKLNDLLTIQWIQSYDGNNRDYGNAVKTFGNYVYVTGVTNELDNFNNHSDFVTLQYSTGDGGDNSNLSLQSKVTSNEPKTFSLSQNYPNPFNPATVIDYSLPKQSFVTLKVYDLLGREVKTLVNNELKPAGVHDVTFNGTGLPSGIYYYRLIAGDYTDVRKMMLVK